VSDATLLPVPADFPLAWEQPGDERFFWLQDRLHQPDPVTPLTATIVAPGFSVGSSRAVAKLSMPIVGLRNSVLNGYVYLCPVPFMGTPAEMDARFQKMQRLTMELGATVLQDWRETFEPRVIAHCDAVLHYEYDARPLQEVAAYVAGFLDVVTDLWDIHMRVNIPAMNSVFGFEEFLTAVAGRELAERSRLLQQGFDNKSIEMGRAMWDLSRWVREDPSFQSALNSAKANGAVQLPAHARSAEFQERWQAFLDVYGWRSDRFMELGHPSWREEQGSALTQLQGFVRKPDSEDPFAAHRKHAEQRDRLAAEMEAALPDEARPQFRAMLPMAQQYIPIAEDHNFAIDQKAHTVLHHGARELGRRLADAGLTPDADAVFFLRLDEIEAIADGRETPFAADEIAARRALRHQQAELSAPLELGTPPPADMPPDPLVTKFFGYQPGATREGATIKGLACSSGTVTGVAKVVLTLEQADKLEAGDILVCPMTMPAWTPLFGVAAAVVADAGGPLSHCAVVAREYGIPCVAGTKVGTQAITDGMRIRVNGDAGTVEIYS